jgi:hypothetical protein
MYVIPETQLAVEVKPGSYVYISSFSFKTLPSRALGPMTGSKSGISCFYPSGVSIIQCSFDFGNFGIKFYLVVGLCTIS